jgi:hypothetical protein
MGAYRRMAEATYVLVAVITLLALRQGVVQAKTRLLLAVLLFLPFAATIGTGNSLFTQVIVALAPWTVGMAVLAVLVDVTARDAPVQLGATAILLVLIPLQVTTSYLRDPYHLAQPLTGQTEPIRFPSLGALQVDPQTVQFVDQIAQARTTCALNDGAAYLGLFNLPGVALVLQAVPPVTPWLNNTAQAEAVLRHWSPRDAERVIIALSPEAQNGRIEVPAALRPAAGAFTFCGRATVPHHGQTIEIWASSKAPG